MGRAVYEPDPQLVLFVDAASTEAPHKLCVDCGQILPLSSFIRNRFRTDGYQPFCSPCSSIRIRVHRGVDPNSARLTPSETDRCGICNTQGGSRGLFLDHDHTTGHFRGWLCQPCNTAIGMFNDDPVRLRRAAEYVEGALDRT